jgi:histidine triad (HIT) family protein
MNLDTQETIFHKIVKGEIPAEVVYEDDQVFAFKDIRPVSPTHVLIIPKNKTIPTLRDVKEEDKNLLGQMVVVAGEIARKQGISEDGYRVVINCGDNGGQEVYQLHMHLLGGRKFTWPPG